MSARKIIYKDGSWFPMLNHIGDLLGKLSAPELRMYIALCARGRGRARHVVFSNVDLMKKAALNRNTLPKAREGLVAAHGIVRAEPTDKRQETYSYELVQSPEPIRLSWLEPIDPVVAVSPGDFEVVAVPVPHDVLFRMPQ